jgi:hypothetical protein
MGKLPKLLAQNILLRQKNNLRQGEMLHNKNVMVVSWSVFVSNTEVLYIIAHMERQYLWFGFQTLKILKHNSLVNWIYQF